MEIACGLADCPNKAGFRCKACKKEHYCSKECQRKAWPFHRCTKPVTANPTDDKSSKGTKRPAEDSGGRRHKQDLIQKIRIALRAVLSALQSLRDNPPANNSIDFVSVLKGVQRRAAKIVELGAQTTIQGSVVPAETYATLLATAIASATRALTPLDDPKLPDTVDLAKLNRLADDVDRLVDRVRSVMLNPRLWIAHFDPADFRSSLPADVLKLIAQKQTPLELDVKALAGEKIWAARPRPGMLRDNNEYPLVVTANRAYYFNDDAVVIETAGARETAPYPSVQTSPTRPAPVLTSVNANSIGASYFGGLGDSLWEVTTEVAVNYMWANRAWHVIQHVDVPKVGKYGRPVGVDRDGRMWVVQHTPPIVGIVHTNRVGLTPAVSVLELNPVSTVSGARDSGIIRLVEPTVTALGLVALVIADTDHAEKTGLSLFANNGDDDIVEKPLAEATQALQVSGDDIDEFDDSMIHMCGDRVSAQLTLVDDSVNQLIRVYDLVTGESQTKGFVAPQSSRSMSRVMRCLTVAPDRRGYLALYQYVDVPGYGIDFEHHVYAISE